MLLCVILLFLISAVGAFELMTASRQKRQYYICGNYPNQFYSLYPCNVFIQTTRSPPNFNQCTNGGQKIGVGCYYTYQCTPYSGGQQVTCLNNCCCTVPNVPVPPPTFFPPVSTTPSVAALAYCYNGQRTQVRCQTSTDCSVGQTCVNAVCCTTTGNEWSGACGGLAALASCQQGSSCGSFSCTTSNYCCECPAGRTSGLCSNGCPSGYSCSSSGYCCATCSNVLAVFMGQSKQNIPWDNCLNVSWYPEVKTINKIHAHYEVYR
ncbi:unnamed protein product [Caenorhabditis auriculariae]|uniref:Uncharacterized protein n=1 Tax=Caenorhabditis auriculariae TaxID=2777116 RepID=A0A8S1HRR0_9PELO|nr:unnamed protein product [Caenorhabditis auriculariae]